MRNYFILLFFNISVVAFSQNISSTLTLEEYIGMVKTFHPIVKQAQLLTSESEAKLMKARGAFDPKLELDFSRKAFKNKEYYNNLYASFKIPTWYGIELKGGFEDNSGEFLNPQNTVPEAGLYSAGVSIPLAKNLLINERRAVLKQAKLYTKQAIQDQKLMTNDIIFNALITYFDWLKSYQTKMIYVDFLNNAELRLNNVKRSFLEGDKPEIDTLEASINLKNRQLDLEKATLDYTKRSLKLSNFLWLNNNMPIQLRAQVVPDPLTYNKINIILASSLELTQDNLLDHPKLQSLDLKKQQLTVEKRLQLNNLLPTINYEHNFITSNPNSINDFSGSNFKNSIQISTPLFLRKERAKLKLAKIKLQDLEYDILNEKNTLFNKIKNITMEINGYQRQNKISQSLVNDYKRIVQSEERKFSLGEGSLFLVNYREVKLIEAQIKNVHTQYHYLKSKAKLNLTWANL